MIEKQTVDIDGGLYIMVRRCVRYPVDQRIGTEDQRYDQQQTGKQLLGTDKFLHGRILNHTRGRGGCLYHVPVADLVKDEDQAKHDCHRGEVIPEFHVETADAFGLSDIEMGNILEYTPDQDERNDLILLADIDAGGLRQVVQEQVSLIYQQE